MFGQPTNHLLVPAPSNHRLVQPIRNSQPITRHVNQNQLLNQLLPQQPMERRYQSPITDLANNPTNRLPVNSNQIPFSQVNQSERPINPGFSPPDIRRPSNHNGNQAFTQSSEQDIKPTLEQLPVIPAAAKSTNQKPANQKTLYQQPIESTLHDCGQLIQSQLRQSICIPSATLSSNQSPSSLDAERDCRGTVLSIPKFTTNLYFICLSEHETSAYADGVQTTDLR